MDVWQISPIGVVTTLAGSADIRDNALDGSGTAASFLDLKGIALDPFEQLLVTDRYKIRRISQMGEVVTVAGKMKEKPNVLRPTQPCPFQFQLTQSPTMKINSIISPGGAHGVHSRVGRRNRQ